MGTGENYVIYYDTKNKKYYLMDKKGKKEISKEEFIRLLKKAV